MVSYGVVWHPQSDNLGDDLQALAALRLMPRTDHVLDSDDLAAPIKGVQPGEQVVTLLSGNVFRMPAHWPPDEHVTPVCVGMHFSGEDVWGVHLAELGGAGLRYLKYCAPIGCRDVNTCALLHDLGISCDVSGCLTLTLAKPALPPDAGSYVCCVDVPDEVTAALKLASPGPEVRPMTHQRTDDCIDFTQRMKAASDRLAEYAGAAFVVTRRLHCAMACLAIGTPVLLLYNSGYEDVKRFAPMDSMLNIRPVDDFLTLLKQSGWPVIQPNPAAVDTWRADLIHRVQADLTAAPNRAPCPVTRAEAAEWRLGCLERMVISSESKIRLLEKDQYEYLHEKFTLLLKEDSVKSTLSSLFSEPEVISALAKASKRRYLLSLPWYRRIPFLLHLKRIPSEQAAEELHRIATDQLSRLGWPQ